MKVYDGFCRSVNTYVQVIADVSSNGIVVSLNCPLRDDRCPCVTVDFDRMPCRLLPDHEIDPNILYSKD